jgi:ketosteroid isomerase-like protein
MKHIIIILVVIVNAFSIYAQNATIESEIRKLEDTEHKAMLKKELFTLQKIWASDLIVNTPVNRITLSSNELIDLVKAGIFIFSSFTREVEQILIKDDVVITMGNETVVPAGKSPKAGQTIKRRYTHFWMKENGSWRLAARHANEICTQKQP